MRVDIAHRTTDFDSYRAARVKSLFNCDDATAFDLSAELDIENSDWRIGVVVGPSGTGKTSIGRALWGGEAFYEPTGWEDDAPIVDCIAPDGDFDEVTGALGSVGLGEVRAWLRPYSVLSNGQQFRADLAKIIAEKPQRVVIDEFTSVVDRQIAKIGANAFSKAWRRTGGQAVLLSCHYDILDWLEPDWVFDTGNGSFQTKEYLQHRRPRIEVEIRRGGWDLWPLFKPYHYLEAGPMIGAKVYIAFVDGVPVAHLGIGTKNAPVRTPDGKVVHSVEARGCRLVVMPEWQGAGVGMRLMNHVAELQRTGEGVIPGRRMTTVFHTSHPQLCAALRRDPRWVQVSANLYGSNKAKSAASIKKSHIIKSGTKGIGAGYGGHFRAVQGFRYVGMKEGA